MRCQMLLEGHEEEEGSREHVDRMGNDRLAKAEYKENLNTTRPLGRPPKRWADSWSSSSQDIE